MPLVLSEISSSDSRAFPIMPWGQLVGSSCGRHFPLRQKELKQEGAELVLFVCEEGATPFTSRKDLGMLLLS